MNGVPMNGVPMNGVPMNGVPINGSGQGAADAPRDGTPDSPVLAYRAVDPWPTAERDDLDAERARLEAEIAAARARAAAARARAAARDAEVRAVLRGELMASKEALTDMERQHDVTVAMVREAAAAEVDRIMAEARQRVVGPPSEETIVAQESGGPC